MSRGTEKQRDVRERDLLDTQIFPDEYHLKQFEKPYRSTVKFCDFLEKFGVFSDCKSIIDVGGGGGANVFYMAKRFPNIYFVGLDINEKLVDMGNEKLKGTQNAEMICGDLYKIDPRLINKFDGVVSYQTLSWLPHYREPIESMVSLNAKWIALTSLFYDGPIDYMIEVRDHSKSSAGKPFSKHYYNIYSLQMVEKVFQQNNYSRFIYEPFEIDIDIDKPPAGAIGTYTEKLESGKRIQISGAILMPWYFILAFKD